jgi:ABC-type uncharacterized transport system substrate-binding protein
MQINPKRLSRLTAAILLNLTSLLTISSPHVFAASQIVRH